MCCSNGVVAVVLIWWLPLFGKGGCRCSEIVGCKCHLQSSQMAFATIAYGICDHCRWHLRTTSFEHRSPPLPNIDHQGFRTSFTTLFEGRRQLLRRPPAPRQYPAGGLLEHCMLSSALWIMIICLFISVSIKVFCFFCLHCFPLLQHVATSIVKLCLALFLT